MSFGAGQDMARSVKTNLKLKGKRKTFFDRPVESSTPVKFDFRDTQLNESQMQGFKERFKKKQQKRLVKQLVITGLVVAVGLVTLLWWLN